MSHQHKVSISTVVGDGVSTPTLRGSSLRRNSRTRSSRKRPLSGFRRRPSPDFSPRGEPRFKVSMVNIRTATPQINRFGTDAERVNRVNGKRLLFEKLRVLWSKGVISGKTTPSRRFRARAGGECRGQSWRLAGQWDLPQSVKHGLEETRIGICLEEGDPDLDAYEEALAAARHLADLDPAIPDSQHLLAAALEGLALACETDGRREKAQSLWREASETLSACAYAGSLRPCGQKILRRRRPA
jgi:hypothetical protein